MSTTPSPASPNELVEAVRAFPKVIAVGARTKARLSAGDATPIDLRNLSGITEYDSSEFTFTALAGTPVRDIAATLAERGQYLPFDPMLNQAGATLGGTVASGLSGSGRFRFGGLRDFILGVRFVDGTGRLLQMGGKVVKNAAGFDLPKFFVGSLGRFGVLAELTFKVFPRPASLLTIKIPVGSVKQIVEVLVDAARTRWELDALDAVPADGAVYARLGGPSEANAALSAEILARWPGEIVQNADSLWSGLAEFAWAHSSGPLVKVPVTPARLTQLFQIVHELKDSRLHLSVGGNAAFISLSSDQADVLSTRLQSAGLSGLVLRGEGALWLGRRPELPVAERVKLTLDPDQRFPSL